MRARQVAQARRCRWLTVVAEDRSLGFYRTLGLDRVIDRRQIVRFRVGSAANRGATPRRALGRFPRSAAARLPVVLGGFQSSFSVSCKRRWWSTSGASGGSEFGSIPQLGAVYALGGPVRSAGRATFFSWAPSSVRLGELTEVALAAARDRGLGEVESAVSVSQMGEIGGPFRSVGSPFPFMGERLR